MAPALRASNGGASATELDHEKHRAFVSRRTESRPRCGRWASFARADHWGTASWLADVPGASVALCGGYCRVRAGGLQQQFDGPIRIRRPVRHRGDLQQAAATSNLACANHQRHPRNPGPHTASGGLVVRGQLSPRRITNMGLSRHQSADPRVGQRDIVWRGAAHAAAAPRPAIRPRGRRTTRSATAPGTRRREFARPGGGRHRAGPGDCAAVEPPPAADAGRDLRCAAL